MKRGKKKRKVSKNVGKRPEVDLDSLNLSIKPLRETRELIKKYPSLMTPFQLKVLALYREKEVRDIVKEDGISKDSVYAVFRSLRGKRRKARLYLDIMRKLGRDHTLHGILSIKSTREEEKTLEEEKE